MEDIDKLYEEGKTTREIGFIIGKSHTWVRKHLNPEIKKKINHKDRLLNHFSFSNINSCEANYWAGFIASDGCISQDKVNGRITVVSCDIDILKKFKKLINVRTRMR